MKLNSRETGKTNNIPVRIERIENNINEMETIAKDK